MAKGDDKRVRNAIDQSQSYLQNRNDNLRFGAIEPEFNYLSGMRNSANQMDAADYGRLSAGFQNFAETGGYSGEDLGNIRSRALSPSRAVYANAMRNVERQRALQGGMSPGYGTLMGRLARDQSQSLSDAAGNTEGMIAQMVQQGKLQGLQGGAGLYGTTPGRSNMFGNQVMQAMDNALRLHQIDSANQLGLGNLRLGAAGIPGAWQQGLNNALNIGKTAAGVIGAF